MKIHSALDFLFYRRFLNRCIVYSFIRQPSDFHTKFARKTDSVFRLNRTNTGHCNRSSALFILCICSIAVFAQRWLCHLLYCKFKQRSEFYEKKRKYISSREEEIYLKTALRRVLRESVFSLFRIIFASVRIVNIIPLFRRFRGRGEPANRFRRDGRRFCPRILI